MQALCVPHPHDGSHWIIIDHSHLLSPGVVDAKRRSPQTSY